MQTPHRKPRADGGFEPRTFLLGCNSANHHYTMQQFVLLYVLFDFMNWDYSGTREIHCLMSFCMVVIYPPPHTFFANLLTNVLIHGICSVDVLVVLSSSWCQGDLSTIQLHQHLATLSRWQQKYKQFKVHNSFRQGMCVMFHSDKAEEVSYGK